MAARAAGGGGVGADCAYLGQGSAAQTCNLSPGPARGRVCFCSSGGRLVPGIGGSVSACFLYIAALCLCKMLPLHADCRLLHKLAAVTVFRRVGHSVIRICKNRGSLYPLRRERSCLPPSKPMPSVSNSPPYGPKHIFFCNYAASKRGVIKPPRPSHSRICVEIIIILFGFCRE